MLLDHPALASFKDSSGQSPLHLAALFNLSEIALALIDAGADPMVTNAHNVRGAGARRCVCVCVCVCVCACVCPIVYVCVRVRPHVPAGERRRRLCTTSRRGR